MRHSSSRTRWTWPRALAIPAFALVCAVVAWHWGSARLVWIGYLGASLLTFMVYALDKSAAKAGRWRVSERTLHLLALFGGWPGALLAQQWLRHKTSKPGFIAMFWLTVWVNVAAYLAWHSGIFPQYFGASLF